MTINGAIMELVMLCEHPMMPNFFKPSIQKVIETISEAELVEPTDTADAPQTDCDKCIWNVCNYNRVDWDADTPQTDSHITCYGTCTDKCGAYENGDCTLNAKKADTSQTDYPCNTCANKGDHNGECKNCVADSAPIRWEIPSHYKPKQTDCPWK